MNRFENCGNRPNNRRQRSSCCAAKPLGIQFSREELLMRMFLPFVILCLLLASCGGGSTSTSQPEQSAYTEAVDAANAKAADVYTFAATSPCSQNNQCSFFVINPTYNDPCGFYKVVYYSMISDTAPAASAASAEYSQLASYARSLAPPISPGTSCTGDTFIMLPVCSNNKCTSL